MLPGHASLPNGFGLGPGGSADAVGVAPNELTSSDDRDWFAGTPHHKHVPARIEPIVDAPPQPSPQPVALAGGD
jgi:formate dehydrogenase